MRIVKLDENTKAQALEKLIGRGASGYGGYEKTVREIIDNVRQNGDDALIEYSEKFDKCRLTAQTLRVTAEEISEAYAALDPALIEVMKRAAENIRSYHEKQKRTSWITTLCARRPRRISLQCPYEYRSRQGGGRREDRHVHASRRGW